MISRIRRKDTGEDLYKIGKVMLKEGGILEIISDFNYRNLKICGHYCFLPVDKCCKCYQLNPLCRMCKMR